MRHKIDDCCLGFCPMLMKEDIARNSTGLDIGSLVFLVSQRLFYNKSTTFCQNNDTMLHVNSPSELQKGGKTAALDMDGIYNKP